MKKITLAITLLFSFAFLQAQEPNILEWNESTHDFGKIMQGSKAQTKYVFTNKSDHPVKLDRVKASCGCTTPKWTREEVAPGKTGEIEVSYNTNRVGPFNKSVRVWYDSIATPKVIYIKGTVNAKPVPPPPIDTIIPTPIPVDKLPKTDDGHNHDGHNHDGHNHDGHDHDGHDHGEANTSVALPPMSTEIPADKLEALKKKYTVPRGSVSFVEMIKNLGNVTSEDRKTVEFEVANLSNEEITFEEKVDAGKSLAVKFADRTLKPGQESVVIVSFDGSKMESFGGNFSEKIKFRTNEKAPHNMKQMSVTGSFKKVWTEKEKASSPKIEFDQTNIHGGKIIEGEKFVYDFTFKNTGQSTLVIESAKASCGCTATAPDDKEIAPGGTSKITATFNSKGRLGKQSKSITVKSNDINSPAVTLKFTVEVEKDPFHAGDDKKSGFGN